MKLFRYQITPVSSLNTPLKSDTLAGQIFCMYRLRYGEKKLVELLDQCKKGDVPFLFSDGLPVGTIPTPKVPAMKRNEFSEIIRDKYKGNKFEALQAFKTLKKKQSNIAFLDWAITRESFSMKTLFLKTVDMNDKAEISQKETQLEPHNTIDRNKNRTLEDGGLFFTETTWHNNDPKQSVYDLYVMMEDDFIKEMDSLLNDVGLMGFGADASVGKGQLKFKRDQEDVSALLDCPHANFWLNLSTFSSSNSEDLNGYYALKTKFGKVWSGFGENNPYKNPILTFEAGSVFKQRPTDFGKCVLDKIHSNNEIIQYLAPLMIPFRWEDADVN